MKRDLLIGLALTLWCWGLVLVPLWAWGAGCRYVLEEIYSGGYYYKFCYDMMANPPQRVDLFFCVYQRPCQ